jgi:hypothetical protein
LRVEANTSVAGTEPLDWLMLKPSFRVSYGTSSISSMRDFAGWRLFNPLIDPVTTSTVEPVLYSEYDWVGSRASRLARSGSLWNPVK